MGEKAEISEQGVVLWIEVVDAEVNEKQQGPSLIPCLYLR